MKLRRMLWTLLLISAVCFSSFCSAAALKYGDRGNVVKEIQSYLIAQNLLHAEADGVYGSSTVAAIKNFQEALGLEVDGICGETTYKILRAAAYDEIDITTFQLGDYVPDYKLPVASNSASSVLSAVSTVKNVVQYAGVGDVIKLGMQGDGVVDLQSRLSELGYYDGEVHGICDATTVRALKSFQSSRGIVADGICGRRTYSALDGNDGGEDEFGIPNYSHVVYVEATAYSSAEPGLSAYTATGTLCRRGVIAADPNFVPLGTRVFIPGYGYAVVEDVGGAIVGNVVDLAMDTVGECYDWGRRFVPMYILED